MKGFRVILFIGLLLGIFTVALLVVVTESLSTLHAQKENRQGDHDNGVVHGVFDDKTVLHFYFVRSIISLAGQIYFYICINSLYHKIEDETSGEHLPAHNTSINQQQKSEGIYNIVCQLPPKYNEVIQTDRSMPVAMPDVNSGDLKS